MLSHWATCAQYAIESRCYITSTERPEDTIYKLFTVVLYIEAKDFSHFRDIFCNRMKGEILLMLLYRCSTFWTTGSRHETTLQCLTPDRLVKRRYFERIFSMSVIREISRGGYRPFT